MLSGTTFAYSAVVERRRLGNSNLTITPVGLGTWAIGGGDWVLGWGPQNDAQSLATIRRALDLGVNWIDTAAVYGLGHAETIVAKALRGVPIHERPYLFTKCGLVWDELGNVSHNLSRRSIRAQAEASLRRLAADRIDLYQIGWPVWPTNPAAHSPGSLENAWEEMAALQAEGKIRHLGISSRGVGALERLQRIAPVTSIGTRYSLLQREAEQCAPARCQSRGVGVIACSTLGSGILTGTMTAERVGVLPCNDWRRRHPFFGELARSRVSGLLARLSVVARRHNSTPAAAAIAWTLRDPRMTAAVVGARRPHQVEDIVQAASIQLTDADLAELGRGL